MAYARPISVAVVLVLGPHPGPWRRGEPSGLLHLEYIQHLIIKETGEDRSFGSGPPTLNRLSSTDVRMNRMNIPGQTLCEFPWRR